MKAAPGSAEAAGGTSHGGVVASLGAPQNEEIQNSTRA